MRPHEDLRHLVLQLFTEPTTALGILGYGEWIEPWTATEYLDVAIPVLERLWMFDLQVRTQIEFLVQQRVEFDDGDPYVKSLESQGLALLLILRDFWRYFPELEGLG